MIEILREANVEIWFRDSSTGNWSNWLMSLAPLILLGALWFIMIRQMKLASSRRQQNSNSPTP